MTDDDDVRRGIEAVKCKDDAVAPVPDWFVCTLPDAHEGDHVAQGKGEVARWPRSGGRALGELRRRVGIEYRP